MTAITTHTLKLSTTSNFIKHPGCQPQARYHWTHRTVCDRKPIQTQALGFPPHHLSYRNHITTREIHKRESHKRESQERFTREIHKRFTRERLTREVHKRFARERFTREICKRFARERFTREITEGESQERFTKEIHKRFTSKNSSESHPQPTLKTI